MRIFASWINTVKPSAIKNRATKNRTTKEPRALANIIEFETERLRLRQWLALDAEEFAIFNADARVMEFFPAPLTRVDSDAMLERCRGLIAERGWGFWALEEKSSNRFIGFTGLHTPLAKLPCSPCVEIGWRLGFQYWGRGYATEAALGALAIGFDRLQLSEIVAFTPLQNIRSQAVMVRLAMRRDAATFEHPALPQGSELKQHYLYRIQRDDWLGSHHQLR